MCRKKREGEEKRENGKEWIEGEKGRGRRRTERDHNAKIGVTIPGTPLLSL